MKEPTQDYFEDIAKKSKFFSQTVEQVYWMKKVLYEMQKTSLGKDFALMGGSAIAFLYENIYRLSVDLDLDYIGNADIGREGSHELEEVQNKHFEIIEAIGRNLGLDVTQTELTRDKRFSQFVLKYRSVYGPIKSVDLDLGYRYCHAILDTQEREFPDFIEKTSFKVQTFAPEELWASKITAAIGGERMDAPEGRKESRVFLGFKRKIRHLYDCFHLIDNIVRKNPDSIDLCLLRNMVILLGATRIEDFEFFRGDLISLYSDDEIDSQLRPVLRTTKDPPDLKTMKRVLRSFLDQAIFSQYDENIYEFFEDFTSSIFRPERLFDAAIAKRLKGMYYYDEILGKVIKRKET